MKLRRFRKKVFIAGAVALGVFVAIFWSLDFSGGPVVFGLTYSSIYARDNLHLDPDLTLRAILDDLKPRAVRLVAYWSEIERESGTFDFRELDREIREAETRSIPVILAIGYRTPRWPECYIPGWVHQKNSDEFRRALFDYLKTIVTRYNQRTMITTWQVENEPLLGVFGSCPPPDRELLTSEIAFVKSLDSRPIMTTASGELSFWVRTAGIPDVFGTTLYRYIWNQYVGNFTHIFPPAWYTLRAWFAEHFLGTKKVVIAELQAEPWGIGGRSLPDIPFDEQTSAFGVAELKSIVRFARKTGFPEIYLWGPEWWYWRKIHGDPSFWEAGKEIFAGGR